MRSLASLPLITAVALGSAGTLGCLPGDERPEPGSLLMNVRRSAPAADGFNTDDGWAISFDRFVTALGGMRLRGDDCIEYSNSGYDRLYDFAVADTSKVALHYGLGRCTLVFRMLPPSPEAILMAGVTEADRTIMGINLDEFEDVNDIELEPAELPIGLMLRGRASRAGVTKTFFWLFHRSYAVRECGTAGGERAVNTFDLRAGDALTRHVELRPEEIFRTLPSADAPIEFGHFAAADVNDDGVILQEELAAFALPPEVFQELFDDYFGSDFPAHLLPEPNLETLVQDVLAARVPVFEGASECDIAYNFNSSF